MGEAGLVESLDGLAHILEVDAVARLIAKRPDEDARMVAHPADMVL